MIHCIFLFIASAIEFVLEVIHLGTVAVTC